jgi:hypothetical protein
MAINDVSWSEFSIVNSSKKSRKEVGLKTDTQSLDLLVEDKTVWTRQIYIWFPYSEVKEKLCKTHELIVFFYNIVP